MDEFRPRALIADDERINLLIFEKMLQNMNLEVTTASDGSECISLCEKNQFDYIFLDQHMPHLNGTQTMIALKQKFASVGREVPIICVTGLTAESEKEALLKAGFTDYLAKPIEIAELEKILKKYENPTKDCGNSTNDCENSTSDCVGQNNEMEKKCGTEISARIAQIDGIDIAYGIEHCGSEKDFLEVLKIYGASIEEKSERIENCLKNGDWENLRLASHAIKSTSKAVGALEISDLARQIEDMCSSLENIDVVRNLTKELLEKYKKIQMQLQSTEDEKSLTDENTKNTEKQNISEEQLFEAEETLKELALFYDSASIKIVLDSINEYNLPDDWKIYFNKLKTCFTKMDWENARSIMEEFGKTHKEIKNGKCNYVHQW